MKYFQGMKHRDEDSKYLEVVFETGDSATPVLEAKKIVDLYGGRKPIMVSEGGVSHYIRTANENAGAQIPQPFGESAPAGCKGGERA